MLQLEGSLAQPHRACFIVKGPGLTASHVGHRLPSATCPGEGFLRGDAEKSHVTMVIVRAPGNGAFAPTCEGSSPAPRGTRKEAGPAPQAK